MRDLALATLVAIMLPFCFRRPWMGILFYVWFSLMNPHRLTYGFAYSMPWAFIIAVTTLAGMLVFKERKSIAWTPPMVLMLACLVYFTLTTFFAQSGSYAWDACNRFAKIVLIGLVLPIAIYGRMRIKYALMVTALSVGFYGFKGGVFTLTHGGAFQVRGPASSFIEDNNALGCALVMVVPLLLWLARDESRKWLRRLYFVTMWLTMLSAVFTYSRGAMVGLAITAPMLFLRSKRKALVILVLVPVAYFGSSLVPTELYDRAHSIEDYQTDTSAMQRLQAWGVAYNVAKERPFTGGGFMFEMVPDDVWLSYAPFMVENASNYARAAHSIYFQVLGNHGFVAFGLFMGMLVTTLLSLRRMRRLALTRPDTAWIADMASAIQISMLGYMVSGAFLSLAYFDLPYILIAITATLHRELVEAQAVAAGPASVSEPVETTISSPGRIRGAPNPQLRKQ